MTTTERAQHGYTITEWHHKIGSSFGVAWYDNGQHCCGFETVDAAERYAERCYNSKMNAVKQHKHKERSE